MGAKRSCVIPKAADSPPLLKFLSSMGRLGPKRQFTHPLAIKHREYLHEFPLFDCRPDLHSYSDIGHGSVREWSINSRKFRRCRLRVIRPDNFSPWSGRSTPAATASSCSTCKPARCSTPTVLITQKSIMTSGCRSGAPVSPRAVVGPAVGRRREGLFADPRLVRPVEVTAQHAPSKSLFTNPWQLSRRNFLPASGNNKNTATLQNHPSS